MSAGASRRRFDPPARLAATSPTGRVLPGRAAIPAVLLLFIAALGVAPLTAQTVHGVVQDAQEQPLEGVLVSVLDRNRVPVARTMTDDEGQFEVRAPRPGAYYLYVNRIGYHSLVDGPYTVEVDRSLEVWVVMHPDPIRMEGITGMADARVQRLTAVGFYERKETGWGHFIEREEFQRKAVRHVTEAFRNLPRVRVPPTVATFGGNGPPTDLLNPQLLIRSGARYCSPTLLIDGGEVHRGGFESPPLRPDDWLVPQDVEAVEIYTGPVDLPIQYTMNSPCGLVMVWTKHTPAIIR